jgi:hypothetical protein
MTVVFLSSWLLATYDSPAKKKEKNDEKGTEFTAFFATAPGERRWNQWRRSSRHRVGAVQPYSKISSHRDSLRRVD